jgi:TPR repeat protein
LGLPKDPKEAPRFFALGDAEKRSLAMVDVGQRLNDGRGVAKNEQEALQWFLKAAELGDRTRAFYVALTYRYGGRP